MCVCITEIKSPPAPCAAFDADWYNEARINTHTEKLVSFVFYFVCLRYSEERGGGAAYNYGDFDPSPLQTHDIVCVYTPHLLNKTLQWAWPGLISQSAQQRSCETNDAKKVRARVRTSSARRLFFIFAQPMVFCFFLYIGEHARVLLQHFPDTCTRHDTRYTGIYMCVCAYIHTRTRPTL